MAWSLIASTSVLAGQNGGTTPAIDTTGASLIVWNVCFDPYGSITTLSDTKGNTWLTGGPNPVAGPNMLGPLYAENPLVGTGHTFTCSGTNNWLSMVVMAFSGAKLSAVLDQFNGNANDSASSLITGSVAPSEDGELLVAQCLWTATGTLSVASGYSTPVTVAASGGTRGSSMAYKIQTLATTDNPVWTCSTPGVLDAKVYSFKSGPSYKNLTGSAAGVATVSDPLLRPLIVGVGHTFSVTSGPSGACYPSIAILAFNNTGLLAHTANGSTDSSSVTTASIDTTGATLLVVGLAASYDKTDFTLADSKGNTWKFLRVDGSGYLRAYAVGTTSLLEAAGSETSGGYASGPMVVSVAGGTAQAIVSFAYHVGSSAACGSDLDLVDVSPTVGGYNNGIASAALLASSAGTFTASWTDPVRAFLTGTVIEALYALPVVVATPPLHTTGELGSPASLLGAMVLGAPPEALPAPITTLTRTVAIQAAFFYDVVHLISDISPDGWTNQTTGPATYPDISEPVPDDATWVLSPGGVTHGLSAPIVFGLPPMPDPGPGGTVRLLARAGPPVAGTTTASLRVDLLTTAAVQVGSQTVVVPTSGFDWITINFTAAETNAYRTGNGFVTGGQLRLYADVP